MKPTVPPIELKNLVSFHETLLETLDFCIANLAKAGVYTSVIDFSSKVLGIQHVTLSLSPD